jgi:hypothetical protein
MIIGDIARSQDNAALFTMRHTFLIAASLERFELYLTGEFFAHM